jgi:hypothetical protein
VSREQLGFPEIVDRLEGVYTPGTLRHLMIRGEFPHRKLPGRNRIFAFADEIDAWLDGVPLEVRRLTRGGRIVKPVWTSRRAA